jgi:hypothetical protein
MTNKKARTRKNKLPRKSKLRGRLERLNLRIANTPNDQLGMHYITPGSMNSR